MSRLWDKTERIPSKVLAELGPSQKVANFYDKNGLIVQVSDDLSDDDLKKVASDVVLFTVGTTANNLTTYVLRSSKYDSLMRRIHSKRAKGEDSTIRFCSVDDPVFVTSKLSALPEASWRRALAKCSDIGFSMAGSTVVSLLAILLKTLVSGAPFVGGDFAIFLLLLSIGLAIGSGMQFIYRKVAAEVP
jgi:hypothetical protein